MRVKETDGQTDLDGVFIAGKIPRSGIGGKDHGTRTKTKRCLFICCIAVSRDKADLL
jgi:hypothetical protein